jgi:hypothetical protein
VPTSIGLGAPGDTIQLRALATFDDGSKVDVTNEATWSVVNPAVLAVSRTGLVTAVSYGGTIVSVAYRNRAGEASLSVGQESRPQFGLTAVVLNSETEAPVAGAFVSTIPVTRAGVTDGNGFVDLGTAAGQVTLSVVAFGHADGTLTVPDVAAATSVGVRLAPNPRVYIERTIDGRFESLDENDIPTSMHRIVTRTGGFFDAVVRGDCREGGSVYLEARSGSSVFPGSWFGSTVAGDNPCASRVRFTVPDDEVRLIVRGSVPRYTLTFREPR